MKRASGVCLLACAASMALAAEGRPRLVVETEDAGAVARLLGADGHPLFRGRPGAGAPAAAKAFPRDRFHVLELPEGADAEEAARAAVSLGLARRAEVDRTFRADAMPNDPYFGRSGSWGQLYDDQWGPKALQFPAAWDTVKGSSAVIVAVIDTGIDLLHPDLQGAIWTNAGEIPGNGIDDDGNGYVDDVYGYDFATGWGGRDSDPTDGHGHGTLIAGIIAADTDNGKGIAGATWGCRVMGLKALDDTGVGYLSDVAPAVLYALDEGAKVINLSISSGGRSTLLESMVETARQAGVVVVASAGNYAIDVDNFTPANIDDAVTVAALDQALKVASFSDYGATIDVAVPGVDILGARALATDFMQDGKSVLGTDYYHATGTSFAAAQVSAMAALLLTAEPTLSRDRAVNVLRAASQDISLPGLDERSGWGLPTMPAVLGKVRDLTARLDAPGYKELLSYGAPFNVTGTAAGGAFKSWQLFIGPGTFPTSYTALTGVMTTPVTAGFLYSGASAGYAKGLYTLDLRVTGQAGDVYEDRRLIEIDHTRGNIAGSVSWQVGGTPATGVMVWAMDPATQSFVTNAPVDGLGKFTFPSGLSAGSYVIYVDASYSEYVSEFWKDSPSFAGATPVTVTAMTTTTGIDVQLARRPRLSGKVTDTVGAPLAGRIVELLYKSNLQVAASASTAGDGTYLMSRLPENDFYVRARAYDGSAVTEYWQESPNVGGATVVTLANDMLVTGIDFTLAKETASISGKVNDVFGRPLAGFPVEVFPKSYQFLRFVTTDSAGSYTVSSLPAGEYLVRTGQAYDYDLQYFDRAPSISQARVIYLLKGFSYVGANLVLGTTWFADITGASGTLMDPEAQTTIGVVPARLDGDDRPDLYLVNEIGPDSYLLQDATGTFRDEAASRGAGAADLKSQAVAFDLENDGDPDLFVAKYGRFGAPSLNLLLENDGARFTDATFDAGVVSARTGLDACVGDYDNDGFLDLYVVNNWDVNLLYRNEGDGTFADVTAASGAGGSAGNNTQNATFIDVDGDRDLDLFVTCSELLGAPTGNLLFINQGSGTFSEEAKARGVMGPSSAFAATFGDVDGDGDFDLFVGSPYGGVLYENDGAGLFTDRTAAWGLTNVTTDSGSSMGDLDNDGRLDLVIADYQGGAALYMNTGASFVGRSYATGFVRYGQSRHLALVDLDLDGRLDVVLSHDGNGDRIYRNRRPAGHYIEIRLHGSRSNREGIGALVRAVAGGASMTRACGIGDAGNKVYPVVHLGLGTATAVDLTVTWPSGLVQSVSGVAADQLIDLWEPVSHVIAAAPGPGQANTSLVRLFAGDGAPLAIPPFTAYGAAGYGARLAAGVLSLGAPSRGIVTMPGDGPTLGPHVRGFEQDGTPLPAISFYAYGTLKYGGNVALATGIDPLTDSILTGPGAGVPFGAQVRGFDRKGSALPGLSFFAYATTGYGVRPSASDLDGDGKDEILSAPGPGGGFWCNVRSFSYSGSGVQAVAGGSFFAYTGATAGGQVAGGEGFAIAAPGPSAMEPAEIRGFSYQGKSFVGLPGYDVIVFPGHAYGCVPALEDLDDTGFDEAVIGAGPGPAYWSHVRGVRYTGSAIQLMGKPNFFAFAPSYGYGANAAADVLGL